MKTGALYFLLICIQCVVTINGNVDDIEVSANEFTDVANSLDFTGKVVVVTGSSSGIGAAAARLFSRLGAKVVVTGRDRDRITKVANDCCKLSPKRYMPLAIKCDLTVPGNPSKLVNETIAAFNRIDVLVNTAVIFEGATILDSNYNEVYRKVRATNVDAPMEVTRCAAPYLQSSKGSIIFMSSLWAENPVQAMAPYSISKGTILALARSLAVDLGPYVRVNVLSPGIVDGLRIFRSTPPCENVRGKFLDKAKSYTALQRGSVPLDAAKLIVFLASNLASAISGQDIHATQGAYIAS